jgi:uncharacterized protein (TIGR03067 family)
VTDGPVGERDPAGLGWELVRGSARITGVTTMRTVGLMLLVVVAPSVGQEKPQDQTAKDAEALKGKWEITSSEFEGQSAKDAYRPGTVIVIEGDELYFTDGFTKSPKAKFKLDTSTKPKSIDVGVGKGEKKAAKGIYSLDKDTLKLCLSLDGDRPKEFKTKAGDKANLFVLKCQKP